MIVILNMKNIGVVSDAPIYDFSSLSHLKTPVLASNVCVEDERIIPMPIGARRLFDIPNGSHENLCLYCARPITQERWKLQDMFSKFGWVTMLPRETSNSECIRQMGEHKFVLSPYGLGFDCCKTWEALLCGSYPVVKRQYFLEHFAKHLPIVVIDNWEEVTEDFLNAKYKEFQNREWNYEMLTEDYWKGLNLPLCLSL